MGAQANRAPVIIKRKKVVGGGGHHGGAWKVAYADFVTAMMAFFMLMWLLNATTEKQRKGIADFFNPTVPINRISGGGDGLFAGDSIFSEMTLARNGTGAMDLLPADAENSNGQNGLGTQDQDSRNAEDALDALEKLLLGRGGESLISENAMRHVVTRVTDEGLIIELFDLAEVPLFEKGSSKEQPILRDLLQVIAEVSGLVTNGIAVESHIRAHPHALATDPGWTLGASRSERARQLLVEFGLNSDRIQRVTGHADREPVASDPMDIRNNRVEIILLRSDQ